MKLTLIFIMLIVASSSMAKGGLPNGAIKEGSLSTEKLIRDAMIGVSGKLVVLGCSRPDNFKAYVLQLPTGKVGARVWRELWMVKGCGKSYPVKIMFIEDGTKGVTYVIQK